MTLRTFFPYILYVNDVITPGAVNFRNQSEPVRVNISGDDQWFIFRKLIDDAGDAIFNVAVKSKTSLDLRTIYFVNSQSNNPFHLLYYQLFYKQRPVKFSITVHITDTGTLKQTIFFSQIFHHQVKIYRWVFNSLPANGDYCRLLINFANGLVPDQA